MKFSCSGFGQMARQYLEKSSDMHRFMSAENGGQPFIRMDDEMVLWCVEPVGANVIREMDGPFQ